MYLNGMDKVNKCTWKYLELGEEISSLEDHVRGGDERVAPRDSVQVECINIPGIHVSHELYKHNQSYNM